MLTFQEKLDKLKELIEVQTELRFIDDFGFDHLEVHLPACKVKIVPGKKYTKVDVGSSGKYMVVNETGEIYGIKAYGVIHRGHYYGTLDTIAEWTWGDYTARRRTITAA